jgi:threonine/homoserine/homoserine lactone efflux protein
MGFDTLRRAYDKKTDFTTKEATSLNESATSLRSGFIASIANPYFIVWWASVGGTFIINGQKILGWVAPIVFLILHWLSDFPWFGFISFSVSKGRRFLREGSFKVIIGVCGLTLMALGFNFLKDLLKP